MTNLKRMIIICIAVFLLFAGCKRNENRPETGIQQIISRVNNPFSNDFWRDICIFANHVNERYNNDLNKEWEIANDLVMDLLLVYFNSIESTKRNTNELLPFLDYDVSEDGPLRVYSWIVESSGTSRGFYRSIVQYIDNDLQAIAVNIDDFITGGNVGKGSAYGTVFDLKDDRYLIFGGRIVSAFTSIYVAVAVKKEIDRDGNVRLVPLPVFNGENTFEKTVYYGRQHPQKMVIRDSDFDSENIRFIITYDEVIDDTAEILPDNENENLLFSTLEFVFNGTEFIGNYNKLHQIVNSYMVQ